MRSILVFLWRAWFAVVCFVAVLIVTLPILILSTNKNWYPATWQVMRFWGILIFYGTGLRYTLHHNQIKIPQKPCVFVSNHCSLMDIPLMMCLIDQHPVMFMGKKELARYPIFGYLYKKTNILVDRSDKASRMHVFREANAMAKLGRSIVIFPEGGVPDDENIELDAFKDGAFSLAILNNMPIVAYTFCGLKEMFPFSYTRGYPGRVQVYLEKVFETEDLSSKDKDDLKAACRSLILKRIQSCAKK